MITPLRYERKSIWFMWASMGSVGFAMITDPAPAFVAVVMVPALMFQALMQHKSIKLSIARSRIRRGRHNKQANRAALSR